jgi:hypothetical protein
VGGEQYSTVRAAPCSVVHAVHYITAQRITVQYSVVQCIVLHDSTVRAVSRSSYLIFQLHRNLTYQSCTVRTFSPPQVNSVESFVVGVKMRTDTQLSFQVRRMVPLEVRTVLTRSSSSSVSLSLSLSHTLSLSFSHLQPLSLSLSRSPFIYLYSDLPTIVFPISEVSKDSNFPPTIN